MKQKTKSIKKVNTKTKKVKVKKRRVKKDKKDKFIMIKVTETEKVLIQEYAKTLRLSMSSFVMRVVLDYIRNKKIEEGGD